MGVRVAGFFKMGFIMDPTIAKDGDLWIELIYLVLQELRSLSLSSDGSLHLVILPRFAQLIQAQA